MSLNERESKQLFMCIDNIAASILFGCWQSSWLAGLCMYFLVSRLKPAHEAS